MNIELNTNPAARLFLLGVLAVTLTACGSGGEQAEAAPVEAEAGPAASSDRVIVLDSTAQRLAGIELVSVSAAGARDLVANGTIAFDENRVSVVAPRADGRIVAVRADLGQRVGRGETLALLESTEVGQTRGELESARARMEVARRNYEREKRLFEQKISSEKEMLEAEGEYRVARAELNSAAGQLKSLGASRGSAGAFALVSPVSGTVVERNARPGQVVGPETELFTVADLRHVWITTDVYEQDLPRVRRGESVAVIPRALEGDTFPGKVTYAGGVVDPSSRTFKVRVEVENESLRLRPGMFATVRIDAPPVAGGDQLAVPEVAVQEVDGKQVVFVPVGPARYAVRAVTLGATLGDSLVMITAGLSPGERVVGRGAFQLKSELTKASFGEEG